MFELITHIEVIEFKTDDGIFKRTNDLITNRLVWWNEFKQYEYKDNKWHYYTKRKGYIKSDEKCWIEDEYKKYLRKNKLKSVI